MQNFSDKVAVITGAGSGIGRAIAGRCAQEGMRIVLAGINADTLTQAEEELMAQGAQTLAVVTDVTRQQDVEALARKTIEAFGSVHLLVNNAGVCAGTTTWESTLNDWAWVLGVNVWGVVYGLRTFIPIMLAQDTPCHIVNTASVAGLISDPNLPIYNVSKHAVVTLSETLYHELAAQQSKIKVSVLCPAYVYTRIMDAERNRPPELCNPPQTAPLSQAAIDQAFEQAIEQGMPPEQVAEHLFNGLCEGKFYILTHPEWKEFIRLRFEDILAERNPTLPPLPHLAHIF